MRCSAPCSRLSVAAQCSGYPSARRRQPGSNTYHSGSGSSMSCARGGSSSSERTMASPIRRCAKLSKLWGWQHLALRSTPGKVTSPPVSIGKTSTTISRLFMISATHRSRGLCVRALTMRCTILRTDQSTFFISTALIPMRPYAMTISPGCPSCRPKPLCSFTGLFRRESLVYLDCGTK